VSTVAPTTEARFTDTSNGFRICIWTGELLLHRLRSLLTMLGMIFGVAAVVSMLSIGAGARQKVMALIEQMGVRQPDRRSEGNHEWQAHRRFEDYARTHFAGLPRDSR